MTGRAVRVLHVINGEFFSGAERVQDLLAERLPEFGYEVGFACLKPDRFPAMRRSRSALHEIPMRSRIDLFRGCEVARLIRAGAFRLIHTHTPRSAMIGRIAATICNRPMVHHVHSPTLADTEKSGRNRVNAALERLSVAGDPPLIAVSESVARTLVARGLDPSRVTVVPNGVPSPGPLVDRPAPEAPFSIGTVALFRPRKGLEVLVQAVAMLKEQGVAFRLHAIGPFDSPDYRGEIRDLVERHDVADRIDWIGFVRDVDRRLSELDALVVPSRYGEGLPMVVLEAMASGVPVVATRVDGIPEAIRHGQDGLLVPPDDPRALCRALGEMLEGSSDHAAMRRSAYRRHAELFSDRAMAGAVARIYREVLER